MAGSNVLMDLIALMAFACDKSRTVSRTVSKDRAAGRRVGKQLVFLIELFVTFKLGSALGVNVARKVFSPCLQRKMVACVNAVGGHA